MSATPTESNLKTGIISRLAKHRWIKKNKLTSEAFDLRDRTPPETYVSFNLCDGTNDQEIKKSAIKTTQKNIQIKAGEKMFLLNIEEVLNEINEEKILITFRPKKLPHCGLEYCTNDQTLIQEAKSVLCLMAEIFEIDSYLPVDNITTPCLRE